MKGLSGVCAMVISMAAMGQELLPNGDFETYTQCPDYVSQIDRATGWSRPTEGTSDYMNACLGVPFSLNVPDNEFGYQAAHSGDGYAGFYCFHSYSEVTTAPDGDHEYVTHALAAPLTPGRQYTIEFFVSLADVSKYAVNDIGALLSMAIPTRTDEFAITGTPQVTNTSLTMLNDKTGWARIHGCVIADSAYAFITVGNFRNGASTVFAEVPSNFPLIWYSYYYVDDISVKEVPQPLLGPDITTCDAATLSVIDPIPGATYTWSTGEVGNTIEVDTAGTYSVQLGTDGCAASDTVVVNLASTIVLTLATDTLVDLCAAPTITIGPTGLPTNASVQWSTGEHTRTIEVAGSGAYTVTASAPDRCSSSATITVIDTCTTPVYVPNAFSPNEDGINDRWQPVWRTNAEANIELTVFDRWGQVLFASTGNSPSWDGRVNGNLVPIGSYVWKGHARDPNTQVVRQLSGHVVLVR